MIATLKNDYGNKLYNAKQYKSALSLYSEAIDISPNTAIYYGNRAACFMMLQSFVEALEDVRKSVQIDPTFVKGYQRMTKCGIATGNIRIAKYAVTKVQELRSDTTDLSTEVRVLKTLTDYDNEASEAYQNSNYEKVVSCMDKCLKLAPTCNHYKLTKAECLIFIGRYQEAQYISNSILNSDKSNFEAMYINGLSLFYQENLDGALKIFRHVLRVAPEHLKAMHNYKSVKTLRIKINEGEKAYKACRFQEAYHLYTEALEIDHRNKKINARLYLSRSNVFSKLGKILEAIADCTSALKLNGNFLQAMIKKAECYMDLEEFEYAVQDLEKVCEINDSEENRKFLLKAKTALEKAMKKPRDHYNILGVFDNANGDEIRKAYKKKALIHHPDKHTKGSEFMKKIQEKKFKEVAKAYAVLSDPIARKIYDLSMKFKDFRTC